MPSCRKWFCNSRGNTSGSHIVNHLVSFFVAAFAAYGGVILDILVVPCVLVRDGEVGGLAGLVGLRMILDVGCDVDRKEAVAGGVVLKNVSVLI